jgi:hypothetical protein
MSQTEETIEVKIQPTVYVQVMMPGGVLQVFERPIYAQAMAVGPQGIAGAPGTDGATGPPGQSAILGTWEGVWSDQTQYPSSSLVQHEGSTYFNASPFITSEPPNAEVPPAYPWELVAAGAEQAEQFKYVHNQLSPSAVWLVFHGLGGFPNVTAIDSSFKEIVGDLEYLDLNSLKITFASSTGGQAFVS